MAIDGSFNLHSELERFLSRCPRIAVIPEFEYLVKKGDNVTEEEVVKAVGELFLHPNYTIPLVGCFRPVVVKIVERAVGLLRLVPDLSSNSDDSMVEFDEDKFLREDKDLDNAEVMHVVDVYVRTGKGLSLHEISCLAFCRALELVPFLLRPVLDYFKFAPPPFERIKLTEYSHRELLIVGSRLLKVVRTSYRFLLAEPGVFTTLWNWSSFMDFVQLLANSDLFEGDEVLKRNILDIRWCGIQILSWVMKLHDRAASKFNLGPEEAFLCYLRWLESCQDISLERASWFIDVRAANVEKLGSDMSNVSCSLSELNSEFHDILASNWKISPWTGRNGMPFILTASLKKSFEMVYLAVNQKWPVLLHGPAGSGKTALINMLAQHRSSQVLSIHMDEHIDGKTLLGSYVCTEQPGEFRWQPGSLTQAVLKGYWVIFEDVDKAPPDVQSILLPLLEGASSFSSGFGEAVRVHQDFRLFSTVTSEKIDASLITEGKNFLSGLWRRVMVVAPGHGDLLDIVHARYPELFPLAGSLIETLKRMNQLAGLQFRSAFPACHGRFSLRDLMKWCRRIAGLSLAFTADKLSSMACESIYKEAVDIFAAFSTTAEKRLALMQEIARLWGVPKVETLLPVNKPVIQDLQADLLIGRITLTRINMAVGHSKKRFVEISSSVHALERIACSVKFNEPVLLVGETGAGKTTLVQSLAARVGQKLTVLNLSQQSDVADLLGGFQPNDVQSVLIPLYKEFENLFITTFSSRDNRNFLDRLQIFVTRKDWKMLVSGFEKCVQKVLELQRGGSGKKRKRPLSDKILKQWDSFSSKLRRAHAQVNDSGGMIFSFVEGAFVTALRNGEWILLDEVNLAPPEILQRVIGVLEEEKGSLCLAERGDIEYISRHPDFRIFACMNPATDAGKRELPLSLRGRFTEYFVDDVLDDEDLVLFVKQHLDDAVLIGGLVQKIVRFYKAAKKESEERLQDGANQKPQYSLRSLYRALEYTVKARKKFPFQKALYDGFCMFFLTSLDEHSAKLMQKMISSYLLDGQEPQQPEFEDFLKDLLGGEIPLVENPCSDRYVLTKSIEEHLSNLARAVFVGRYPVLLQGPTSSGKTSLVKYLAANTGHEFVRINNHEHTDLQEYLGSYITNSDGKLVFNEGPLVKAIRNGHWIVLDELNLAPSDVLEALNRLLDDNRELYIPELREVVRAHPNFMLFATQNPPNIYGGRKMLSRAFRNRFVEIHVDEIPRDELITILEKRCEVPPKFAKKMVNVMKELQLRRQSSKVFAGKEGYITPRDLFRWANRYKVLGSSIEDLACDGYYLLAERLREQSERRVVQEVLERNFGCRLVEDEMYKLDVQGAEKITWTQSMSRLYFLVDRCYKLREPVLLVGETGGGKTTVCQLLSANLRSKLHILNCHQYTETSDFIGGFFPIRERSAIISEFKEVCNKLKPKADEFFISSDINHASRTLEKLSDIIKGGRQGQVFHPDVSIEEIYKELKKLHNKWQSIFVWQDGPLIEALRKGDFFLVDEISLADDSVLERLNSVLEPERQLSLAEKGGSDLETITADLNFFILATMNPGGDYGKKELSPALRNRFTEIWVPSVSDLNELKCIGLHKTSSAKPELIVEGMLDFWKGFNRLETGRMLTVRDFLSWISFVNLTEGFLEPEHAFLHGAFLVLLDGLNLGTNLSKVDAAKLRKKCLQQLIAFLVDHQEDASMDSNSCLNYSTVSNLEYYGWSDPDVPAYALGLDDHSMQCDNMFGIHPFYILKGDDTCDERGYEFFAPTTRRNALRVLRAMQLAKPVLLEGSPGVGKTSLIVAIGKFSGHKVVRINLSEQTDIMDLLGSDLPVESDEGLQFAWSDGILLQALKSGSWVLLDELNLAPQSVLEGLNSILDHRAEVFIPELGRTFKCPESFRIFACQNPSHQGGGRKGLPKSFLNRFTKVYVDELSEDDYMSICRSLYPSISHLILEKLILFNKRLHDETMLYHNFAQDGSPWEFNLRDVVRSCEMIQGAHEKSKADCFLNTVYVQRMRTPADRLEVMKLYEQVFGLKPYINPSPRIQINPEYLVIGNASIKRNPYQAGSFSCNQLQIMPGLLNSLEAVANCLRHQWLCILVGSPSSGKTSSVRLLAQLTGNVLHEVNISPSTDTSELLGCFEQHNAFRSFRLVTGQVEQYLNEYFSQQLESSVDGFMNKKDILSKWLGFLSSIDIESTKSSAFTNVEGWRTKCIESVPLLIEIIEILRFNHEKNLSSVSWSIRDLDRNLMTVKKFQESLSRGQYSAKFEWIAGVLIKAIENGEWIILENANLCNPTVLDRINSLVEHSGSITINECGKVDGQPLVLHPHPQFRMFLTVNPSFGEVSRAMRNRGVEVYLMHHSWLPGEKCDGKFEETELRDAMKFVVLSGIPFGRLVDMMAKAHVYAKNEGVKLGARITFLDLAHWVQLFKQLITSGNQLIWSLHISWEHTYFSSLGEDKGRGVVAQAINSYLSADEVSRIDKFQDSLISLPGGWPTPLSTRDMALYSRETCVRQNCMYLKFLGIQCASYACSKENDPAACGSPTTDIMNVRQLYQKIFPTAASRDMVASYGVQEQFNLDLVNKMLFAAANWTIEQAVECDIELYLCWFSWFGSLIKPFCPFFSSYVDMLKEEMKHPVWAQVSLCRGRLLSHHSIHLDAFPIPILSMDLVGLSAYNVELKSDAEHLRNSIKLVGLVRRSYQQWRLEKLHVYGGETKQFELPLKALLAVEVAVLKLLVESPDFDVLFRLYDSLLENHRQLWSGVLSSHSELILVSWWSLLKSISRIRDFCPENVDRFLEVRKSMDHVYSHPLTSRKSLLWIHGGHPFMPSSCDFYQKQRQLIDLCEMVWPSRMQFLEYSDGDVPVELVLSSNSKLRLSAMQCISMSACFGDKPEEDDSWIIQQLEELYQKLRLEFERAKLAMHDSSGCKQTVWVGDSSVCCSFPPDLLCRMSGFHSWQDESPIRDNTSFSKDMILLHELCRICLFDDVKAQHLVLSNLTGAMESALKFALDFSSRPPMDLVPHQKILWAVDSWSSTPAVSSKLASYVLEMWFRWHRFLWAQCPVPSDDLHRHYADGVLLPHRLFRSIQTETVDQMLQNSCSIGDFSLQSLKFRVASRDLWGGGPRMDNIKMFLLSAARSLFQKIIFSHRKSFSADTYDLIKSVFRSSLENPITRDDIKVLVSAIASSNHDDFTSLLDQLIQPVLTGLYIDCGPENLVFTIGSVWLRIGCLRYHLLTLGNDLDPAVKYSMKYSQLMERIALIELEISVRKECNLLAGCFQLSEADDDRTKLLSELRAQQLKKQRQIVFRADSGNYKKLKHELDVFREHVTAFIGWINYVDSMSVEQMIELVRNWQEMAKSFMSRLLTKYSAYVDVIEPVLVAIYEIKLGLSLVLSSAMDKKVLKRLELRNGMDSVLSSVYSFMMFPRKCSSGEVYVQIENDLCTFSSSQVQWPCYIETLDLELLKRLITFAREPHLRVFHKNILQRLVHSIAEVCLFDNASFNLLSKIFDEFANSWMRMKLKVKQKKDDDARQFKFRPRALRIENIIDLDISTLGSFVSGESFLEWKEFVTGEELKEDIKKDELNESLGEEDWNATEDSILNDIVNIHNQIFGSLDLVKNLGVIGVSDDDILYSFIDSYTLGVQMIEHLEGTLMPDIDANLMPEHMLRVCLEHESQFTTHKPGHVYNFYKDSNAPVLAKMVEPISKLKQRVLELLEEWDDHPAIRKLLDAVDMVLAIPFKTPLAKVLSGLQFLLNRVWALQETVAKFPLGDHLDPIVAFVLLLQKLEFESGLALLDEVQVQFDVNAARLWFPLFSVLLHRDSANANEYTENTIQGLDEFIRMSNIGEYKRRLQLLIAFYGQIRSGLHRGSYTSQSQEETLKLLYNTIGFYIQFLPKILEHIETNRRSIEKELKDLRKLYRWEQNVDRVSIENSRRARKKLRITVEKYTDLLKQPVATFLAQEVTRNSVSQSMQNPLDLADSFESDRKLLQLIYHQTTVRDELSLKRMNLAAQSWHLIDQLGVNSADVTFKDVEGEVMRFIKDGVPPKFMLNEGMKIWDTVGRVCKTVIDCCDIWGDEHKPSQKRRVFTDLLKLLESCGLSKHKSIPEELGTSKSRFWLLQPSYDLEHLLPLVSACSGDMQMAGSNLKSSSSESLDSEWRNANSFYFKGIASVQVMQQICLHFNKDFTLQQVRRSSSFVEHLIEILQDQRAAAYGFAYQLKCLRDCVWPLANFFSDTCPGPVGVHWSFTQNQYATFRCMWDQKHLLDNLSTMMRQVHLLLQKIENSHLHSCPSIKANVMQILNFVENFGPRVQTFKDLLDLHLLGKNRVILDVGAMLPPQGVTKKMEQLVNDIFDLIKILENNLSSLSRQSQGAEVVTFVILGHFTDLFKKATTVMSRYHNEVRNQSQNVAKDASLYEVDFHDALKEIYKTILAAFRGMFLDKNKPTVDKESFGHIGEWKSFFEFDTQSLKLEIIRSGLMKLITVSVELLNRCMTTNPKLCSVVWSHLRRVYSVLNMILAFGDNLLQDFLVMHRMVSAVAHALAEVLSSLFAKGFGIPEDQINDSETIQDASGTGMGEGKGLNDVSDQIENEDQLLGTSEKPNKEEDSLSSAPSKNEKGIEMEHDIDAADCHSVSEESEDENDDSGGDEQVERAMGKTGASGEIAKEKPFDSNDDENPSDMDETDESGQVLKDKKILEKELRAKNDSASVAEAEDVPEEFDQQDEGNEDGAGRDEMEDATLDEKEDSVSDLGGLNLNEPPQGFVEEDTNVDDANGTEPIESQENEDLDESADIQKCEEGTDDGMDESAEEDGKDNLAENSKLTNQEDHREKDGERDPMEHDQAEETSQLNSSYPVEYDRPTFEPSNPLESDHGAVDLGDVAPGTKWSNSSNLHEDFAPSRGLPDFSPAEFPVTGTSSGGKLGNNRFEAPIPPQETSNQKMKPNPFRSIGDALDGWKERVKVSTDLDDKDPGGDDINDETENEYGYTAEFEKGTAQALGPATDDQIGKNIKERDLDSADGTQEIEDHAIDMELDQNQSSDPTHISGSILNRSNAMESLPENLELGEQRGTEEQMKTLSNYDDYTKLSESLVSVSRSYLSDHMNEFIKLSLRDELGKATKLEDMPSDVRDDATDRWRNTELRTTGLSQELAEQLRLVMEPTLASKLQGDYKTGKRINMKKVIPYIASHYRKDKIWLRRTRPNKRDYQVVIAVDDSRSMEESQCGNVAIDALVTVCRAMSQLEVGKLAVASFGKKGNIKLLHDFDQPFTGEAGIKMISSLTFKQENTVVDEPMVDLLKYLNDMLDAAVVNARLPSGHNPLQQLVLIIADGRFHEKETLKRYVRDTLGKKRMVAYLIVDSPNESIMDVEEATFQGGVVRMSKYLDSFPFPYYVVLKNIEALPRTLAELLRQKNSRIFQIADPAGGGGIRGIIIIHLKQN
ncbi:OLC1v1015101C1 [Oldenlandia corymbosa var. corymbosa]|uniref:Midasin n=1 Tax=Oldenlandia corymbosa var. corymbosa TaxID=529605 RepID=A0AAV1E2G1_OLDCO|nr:OLC1v1015101C1 [Oldenlandia corymbosa var. corymbosa]